MTIKFMLKYSTHYIKTALSTKRLRDLSTPAEQKPTINENTPLLLIIYSYFKSHIIFSFV